MEPSDRWRALFGTPLSPAVGVTHVMAVAREGAAHRVIKIGAHAPKSETDHFVLDASRARADAVLITGAILRAEPTLHYRLPTDLAAWRATHTEAPLRVLILTRGDLPESHPVYESATPPIVFAPTSSLGDLRVPRQVERIGMSLASTRAAIDEAFASLSLDSLSVEAGPSVAVPLYDPPIAVDELLLSVFEGALDEDARGGAFLDARAIADRLSIHHASAPTEEPSGRWRFHRFTRDRRGTPGDSG